MNNSLWQIDMKIAEVLDRGFYLDEETGEIIENIEGPLAELNMARAQKWENIALYVKNDEALVDAIKAEEQKLKKRREAIETRDSRLKDILAKSMIATDKKKYESEKCLLSFRKSESVNITNEAELPEKFLKLVQEYKISKTDIKKALKAGETVTGAELVVKNNLQIK